MSSVDPKTSHLQEGVLTHGLDHSKLISAAQLVSNICTKIAVLFSQSPPTAGCGVLCQQLEQATLQLAAVFHHISPHQGMCIVYTLKPLYISLVHITHHSVYCLVVRKIGKSLK